MNNKYIFYDYETTGLDTNLNDPIEIAAVDNFGNTFQSYVKVKEELVPEIQELTGYNMKFLNENGHSLETAVKSFKKYIFDKNYRTIFMVAHNGTRFDHLITTRIFKTFAPFTHDENFRIVFLDTYALCKLYYPSCKSYRLANLCRDLCNFQTEKVHNALDDSLMVQVLFNKIMKST